MPVPRGAAFSSILNPYFVAVAYKQNGIYTGSEAYKVCGNKLLDLPFGVHIEDEDIVYVDKNMDGIIDDAHGVEDRKIREDMPLCSKKI